MTIEIMFTKRLWTTYINIFNTFVMGNLIVIHEEYCKDKEQIVIGVADSVANANKLIDAYYGKYEQVYFNNIRVTGRCGLILN